MKLESKNKLFETLVALLVMVVAVQSVVMVKLYQRDEVTRIEGEPLTIELIPSAGAAQPPPAASTSWIPPFSTAPYGSLGLDPGTWDPLKEFRGMRQQMDHMFDDSFGRFRQDPDFQLIWGGATFSPSVDLEEQNDRYIVRMDIPGAEKPDISVKINDRELTVSGVIEESLEEQGANHLRKERHSGKFERMLTLPGSVKTDKMEAEYTNGVLVITLPKGTAEGASQTIKVK